MDLDITTHKPIRANRGGTNSDEPHIQLEVPRAGTIAAPTSQGKYCELFEGGSGI
jgi:hypothetical protein